MNHLLSVISDGVLDIWCFLRGKQRELDESSVLGQSEFEKEGLGLLWVVIIGGGLLLTVLCVALLR